MKHLLRCSVASAFVLSFCRALAEASTGDLPLLTTTAQVHGLSAEEARRGYPVRVRGTIMFYDQKHFDTCFIHDESGCISVLTTGKKFPLRIGDRVEMRGVSDPGNFAPMIRALEVDVLGHGELPPPRSVTFESLTTGLQDSQWVELAGVIRSVYEDKQAERLIVEIATGGGRLMNRIRDYDPAADYSYLVDSLVRVRGVCSQLFNQKRQMFNVRLLVPGISDVMIDEPAPDDPFSSPRRSIISLFQFAPDGIFGRRVRVRGVVTYQRPGSEMFIQDDSQSILVQSRQNDAIRPGDAVDVLGFAAVGEWTPILQDAAFRKVSTATEPSPAVITAEDALSGLHDAALVRLEGIITDRVRRSNEEILVIHSGRLIFDAILNASEKRDLFEDFLNGSKVQLTGICCVEVGDGRVPRAFRLLLRTPGDVKLLASPSWWTWNRLLWALAIVSVATLAGWIWVVALGNRVRQQTAVISEQIQREAALEERARLAREFHDTLEQQFTGIKLQLEAVKSKFVESPSEAQEYLDVARSLVRFSCSDARRAVWDLRADALETNDLPTAMRETIANSPQSGVDVRVSVSGVPQRLAGGVENHLLRIGQEAVNNALKHARARAISVELRYEAHQLTLRIADDGAGFDYAAAKARKRDHFGLLGMRERAEKFQGTLEIISDHGQGTTIEVSVPIRPRSRNEVAA